MPVTVTPSTNFRDLEVRQPNSPIPGGKLEDELVALRAAIASLSTQIDAVVRADGKLQPGVIDKNSLNQQLLDSLLQNAAAKVKLDAANAAVSAQNAQAAAAAVTSQTSAATQAAAQAAQAAAQVASARGGALQSISDERAAAADLLNAMVQERAQLVADANTLAATLVQEQDWALVSQAWAEYLGDGGSDTIPSSVLAVMGITGSHWSSRWWAMKAQNAFGKLDALYLGALATPPTQTATGGAIPVGAIYYNTTTLQPYVWNGSAWASFWKPAKAGMATLYYLGVSNQTVFPLATPDLYGSTFTLTSSDPEGIEIYLDGSRLMLGSATVPGDYLVDYAFSNITLTRPVRAGSLLTVDVLTPVARLAPGSVNVELMKDFDLDPVSGAPGYVDGVRTVFSMFRADTGAMVLTTSPEQVMISVDGIIQKPSVDYTTSSNQITFVVPPPVGSRVWGVWYSPAGSATGMGVQPPGPPYDQLDAAYVWVPPSQALGAHAAVSGGLQWIDARQQMRLVKDQAARMELRVPQDIEPGSLVFQQDTQDLWVYEPAISILTPPSPGVAAFSVNADWRLLLPGHPNDQIVRALEYDPSKPNSLAWEDNRDDMETVNAEADLLNRTVLPLSHLAVGKLVYVRATGALWECLVDGANGTATNTVADWKPLGGAGVTYVGRVGNLPDPTTTTVPDGSMFMVNMDLLGQPYHRLYVYDAQGVNAAGVVGVYRPCATRDFLKSLRSDADMGLDAEEGDLQVTLENGHKELKAQDSAGAWQTVYSEDQVKAWIAAGNLFQGTAQDKGHGTVGAIDLDKLPAQSALGITDAGHYYIYVGLAGKVIAANDIGGGASNIDGAKLNVGDWILVANTGTPAAPVMRYTHVPGDLLAKSRGDNLYGLNVWSAGAFEIGSLVTYMGDVYKASRAVLATDTAPGTTGAPWAKVDISGGVKNVASDTNLPATAANGAVYLVLSSAKAGGKQALYSWDQASSKWQPLGGTGVPLDLTGGKKLQNVGNPIGSVIAYAGKTLPAGYLLCDGSNFNQAIYPQLFAVLGGIKLPDLRDQFIRGAATMAAVDPATQHQWLTGRPKTQFTGVTNQLGDHRHNVGFSMSNHNWKGGGSWTGDATCNFAQDGGAASSSNGAHQHTVGIDGGGDSETVPVHVILAYIIKADDIFTTEVP